MIEKTKSKSFTNFLLFSIFRSRAFTAKGYFRSLIFFQQPQQPMIFLQLQQQILRPLQQPLQCTGKLPLFVYAMYHKKVGKFYTILMVKSCHFLCMLCTKKSKQVLYYTYAHVSYHFLCTLCTTKKQASSILYIRDHP